MMKKMISGVLLFGALLINVQSFAQDDKQEAFITQKFPVSSVSTVTAKTSGGSINVSGTATNEAVVEVFVRPNNSRNNWPKDKIQQFLTENYDLVVKVVNGELIASAQKKEGIRILSNGLSISFKISVKKEVASNLRTSGGSIRLSDVSGKQDFSTSGGSLRVTNVSGTILGKTSGGSIHVSGSKDMIDLSTSGGSMTAEDCNGQISLITSGGSMKLSKLTGTIKASTSGGSVNLNDLSGTIEAKTSGGSVRVNTVNGTLTTSTSGGSMTLNGISGNLDAHTSGGSMTVEMQSVKEFVRLSNSGNISLTIPQGNYQFKMSGGKIETIGGVKNFTGTMDSKRLEGSVGSGGPEISVRSSQKVTLTLK